MKRLGLISLFFAGIMAVQAATASASTSLEQGFLRAHQAERISHGLAPLTWNADLARVAQAHSEEMARTGKIWHSAEMPNEIKDWVVLGDNVGAGFGTEDIMQAFMASPAHRANILDGDYREIGIGVADVGRVYVTVIFMRSTHMTATTKSHAASQKSEAREVGVLEQLLALDSR